MPSPLGLPDPMSLEWWDHVIPEKIYCVVLTGGYQTHLYQHDVEILRQRLNAGDMIITIREKTFFREHIVLIYRIGDDE